MALFEELRRTEGPCALLESTSPSGPLSSRSVLARRPRWTLTANSGGVRLSTGPATEVLDEEPFAALRRLAHELPAGGAVVGALAYDFARPPARRGTGPLLLALGVGGLEEEAAAGSPPPSGAGATAAAAVDLARCSNFSREDYRRTVLRLKDHIARGDIYQANLSQRFRVPWPHGGLELYRRLRAISPAPFAGYLRLDGLEIASASPERLLMVEGGRAVTRPIAGTRPRSKDPEQDLSLRAELLLSEKERAEHLMLVDLARNDLGQVAAVGSVEVEELMEVEDYSHVRHIVSGVAASLAPGRDALDALTALFPGGTITGVPKRRCMEILDEVEPVARGFYTGSLFYLTATGRLDANILIRSAVIENDVATFHAGGGIVADSEPDREYEETLHKAEALRLALSP